MMSLIWIFLLVSSSFALFHRHAFQTHNYYVIHYDPMYSSLHAVVDLLGLQIVEPVGELEDIWLARQEKPRVSRARRTGHNDPVIESYRKMRSGMLLTRRGEHMSKAVKHLSRQIPHRVARKAPPLRYTKQISRRWDAPSVGNLTIEDPLFHKQWSLLNNDHPQYSLNVLPVWEKLGYTGKGVVVSVIDDGLMFSHKDLERNFAKAYSWDFINNSELSEPSDEDNDHGTACAGIIAAAKNNICGVGIAYNAKVAGMRIIGPQEDIADADEAKALNYKYQDVSIYSASYGQNDDGRTVGGPAYISKQALLNGVNKGRDGKGSIFVFPSGNGGNKDNDCNYDGYANSIYTITIGAVDHQGQHPMYSDGCTALMAVTYSDNRSGNRAHKIVSVGISDHNACVEDFGGTSAAVPAASAIFALALEARPDLTWRDIQYLCVETAQLIEDENYWDTLASGRKYSTYLGFGVLDAYKFVKAAETWPLVAPQVWIALPYVQFEDGTLDVDRNFSGGKPLSRTGVTHSIEITAEMARKHNFDKIEHVQVRVWIQHERRGVVQVTLHSPNKVVSDLGMSRMRDKSRSGLQGWAFSSLKHWGEDPVGIWTLKAADRWEKHKPDERKGRIIGYTMTLWGKATMGSSASKYVLSWDDENVFPPQVIT